jgi:hypothetical protein
VLPAAIVAHKKNRPFGAAKIVVRFLYFPVFSRTWNNFFSQDSWIFFVWLFRDSGWFFGCWISFLVFKDVGSGLQNWML